MRTQGQQRGAVRRLVDLADVGGFTVPEAITDALETVDRIGGRVVQMRTPLTAATSRATEDLLRGDDPDEIRGRLAEAFLADQAERLLEESRRHAADIAATRATVAVREHGEELIVEHLRPALVETLKDAEHCAEALRPFLPVPSADVLVSADDDARDAWQRAQDLVARYAAIRSAQSALIDLGIRCREDAAEWFIEIRNYDTVVGTFEPMFRDRSYPWPDDPVGRLLWLVMSDAEPWLPTPAEWRARWSDWHEARQAKQLQPPQGAIGARF